jgi:hypothetical protein
MNVTLSSALASRDACSGYCLENVIRAVPLPST